MKKENFSSLIKMFEDMGIKVVTVPSTEDYKECKQNKKTKKIKKIKKTAKNKK